MKRKCGGRIFNRHRWYYPVEYARICTKCGAMQYEFDWGFGSLDFDCWIKRIEEDRARMNEVAKERIRGLNWLEAEFKLRHNVWKVCRHDR